MEVEHPSLPSSHRTLKHARNPLDSQHKTPVGLFAVFPILVSFLFGLKNFGQNWVCTTARRLLLLSLALPLSRSLSLSLPLQIHNQGWMVIAPATGSLSFGFLFSTIYDANTEQGENKVCSPSSLARSPFSLSLLPPFPLPFPSPSRSLPPSRSPI